MLERFRPKAMGWEYCNGNMEEGHVVCGIGVARGYALFTVQYSTPVLDQKEPSRQK